MSIENLEYKVIQSDGNVEIRQYANYIVARTTGGFNDLFNYISGNNNKKKNIAMTVPVLNDFHDGRPTISFVMPKEYGENDLPEPADSNIRIEQIAGSLVAAIRFSGVFSMTKVEKMTNRLSNWIDSNGYKRVSAPRWARYNAPFTPPFMRRNEIHLEIEKA